MPTDTPVNPGELRRTPLYELHQALGARMVPFAGYAMPVQYAPGILQEHLHTRASASLFDVSHMGQIEVSGPDAARHLEALMPVDLLGLPCGQQRYALLTNERGGIIDDLMAARLAPEHFLLVVNAANKAADLAHLRAGLPATVEVGLREDRALLALQGPAARGVLPGLDRHLDALCFMDVSSFDFHGVEVVISCSGYTGEDGFELALPAARATELARRLLADERVAMAGLGARDSLRLEAGLCLHGHDIDADTTAVEAALAWSISPARRPGGERTGGYPGCDIIAAQLRDGAPRLRCLLQPEGRAPVREGAPIVDADGRRCGQISSGGYGPSVGAPVAMGYVDAAACAGALFAQVRGRNIALQRLARPWIQGRYRRRAS